MGSGAKALLMVFAESAHLRVQGAHAMRMAFDARYTDSVIATFRSALRRRSLLVS